MPEGGYRLCQILHRKRGTITFGEVVEAESVRDVKGTLFFSFMPEEYYLFTDKFPQLKPELLDLQIKKRFSDTGLSIEPANLTHTTRKIPDREGSYTSIFLPREELHKKLDQLSKTTGVTQCSLVPAAAAISGFVKTITDKPVLVLFVGMRFSQVLVVKNGIPLYNQSLAQTDSGEVEQALIPNAIDFARLNARKEHDIDHLDTLLLGPGRGTIDLESLGIESWRPDFSSQIQTAQPNDAFDYPHLFGACFADPAYSFLPGNFTRMWRLQRVSKNIALCAVAGSLVMLGGWLYLQPKITGQKAEYSSMLADLDYRQQLITGKMPDQENLDNIERLLKIRNNAAKEFRLDRLAIMLADALPSKVFITDLTMKRRGAEASDSAMSPGNTNPSFADETSSEQGLSHPEILQARKFIISLDCTSEGTYTDVTARFKKAAMALNNLFIVTDYTWNYREQEQIGTIQCKLTPKTVTKQ